MMNMSSRAQRNAALSALMLFVEHYPQIFSWGPGLNWSISRKVGWWNKN